MTSIDAVSTVAPKEQALLDIPASGPLRFTLTNDYMFRAMFQENLTVTTELIAALLDIQPDEIKDLHIENPIMLGDHIEDQDCVLDLRVLLNNNRKLNLEMQVGALTNWIKRSVYYLCRLYAALRAGEDYNEALPCIHIGILTQPLFPKDMQFYSQNYLMDKKTHRLYTGNFGIHVLDLSQMNHATEDEKHSPLYKWARLFLAKTWEEVNVMAENSATFKSVACRLKELSEDEKIQLQCEARERYYADQKAARIGGENRILRLVKILTDQNRTADLIRCTTDDAFCQSLLEEFHIV